MTMDEAITTQRCGAMGRSAKPCELPAGWGTKHAGSGYCKHHTGSTPNGEKHAARQQVSAMAAAMGDGVDADPFETILSAIRQARAEVVLFGELAAEHEHPMEDGSLRPEIRYRQQAMSRAVEYARVAIAAGVAQRQVAIAESLGAQLGGILQRVIGRLELSPAQMRLVPDVVRGELEAIIVEG